MFLVTKSGHSKYCISLLFCVGCFALGKQLDMFIPFKHKPEECTRQGAVARMLQTEDEKDSGEVDEKFYDDPVIHYHVTVV